MHAEATPAELFGPLFRAVQERRILRDGKTFADAIPRRPVAAILADFAQFEGGDAALLDFVTANFDLPAPVTAVSSTSVFEPLRQHIKAMWPALARGPVASASNSSALPVRHPHVVPGGRFRELYYWDSFFTILGLMRDGETELATGMVDTMTDLIETYGHVPNGTRTYYLGRSQPPLYHLMVRLLGSAMPEQYARRLAAMKAEYAWWMQGEDDVEPGEAVQRIVKLDDGSVLNRYWDPRSTPRDESWLEDLETAAASDRDPAQVFRDLRAGAESGWDFSSRWQDNQTLASIRTTTIVPVDLNALLYSLEMAISDSDGDSAAAFAERANKRLLAMHRHCWNAADGCFADFDLQTGQTRTATAASLAPLMCGIATAAQADATARLVENDFLAPGGLRTTLVATGQQWDSPNGWAPLQWIAVEGLQRYGYLKLAEEIAMRWLRVASDCFQRTGILYEKYDVEECSVGGGGEYRTQIGFGWTNGVTRDFVERFDHQHALSFSRTSACPLNC